MGWFWGTVGTVLGTVIRYLADDFPARAPESLQDQRGPLPRPTDPC